MVFDCLALVHVATTCFWPRLSIASAFSIYTCHSFSFDGCHPQLVFCTFQDGVLLRGAALSIVLQFMLSASHFWIIGECWTCFSSSGRCILVAPWSLAADHLLLLDTPIDFSLHIFNLFLALLIPDGLDLVRFHWLVVQYLLYHGTFTTKLRLEFNTSATDDSIIHAVPDFLPNCGCLLLG